MRWKQPVVGGRLGLRLALRRLGRSNRGNFAVLFALSAPVLVLIVGLGLDYLQGLSFKSRWDTAADAAALTAVKSAQAYVTANAANQDPQTLQSNAQAAGVAAGLKAFSANAGASASNGSVTPGIVMSVNGIKYTATVTYSGSIASNFGGLVNVNNLSIAGTSVATAQTKTYINYYFIVDVSQSMGVGSTATDMQNLYNRTQAYGNSGVDGEPGCVFGCHVVMPGNTYTNEYLAHNVSPAITLRIDAAKTAMQNVLADAQQEVGDAGNLQFAIYTMQQDPGTGVLLNQVSGLSSSFGNLSTAVGGIALGNNTTAGLGDTNFTGSLTQFQNTVLSLASSGNGASPSTPINYVFIITDGVQDLPCNNWIGHCAAAFDPALCAPLQANATVGVIYTTYLPVYQNNNPYDGYDSGYNALVLPIASQIAPNLQACATGPNWYYEATDGPALNAAMLRLFASTTAALALSQ